MTGAVARVVAFVPDLLFGSNVVGMLRAAGHDVTLCPDAERARRATPGCQALILDLTSEADERLALFAQLRDAHELEGARTIAFYAHIDTTVRERALAAGVEAVVPRSRMAREGAALVGRLLGDGD